MRVRPFGDVLRLQNQLQSFCSMGFVARNHHDFAQLRLSSEIRSISGFGSGSSMGFTGSSLGLLASDRVRIRSENRNRVRVRPLGDVLRFQNHLQSLCSMGFVARNHHNFVQFHLSSEIRLIYGLGSLAGDGWVQFSQLGTAWIESGFSTKTSIVSSGGALRSQNRLQSAWSTSCTPQNHHNSPQL